MMGADSDQLMTETLSALNADNGLSLSMDQMLAAGRTAVESTVTAAVPKAVEAVKAGLASKFNQSMASVDERLNNSALGTLFMELKNDMLMGLSLNQTKPESYVVLTGAIIGDLIVHFPAAFREVQRLQINMLKAAYAPVLNVFQKAVDDAGNLFLNAPKYADFAQNRYLTWKGRNFFSPPASDPLFQDYYGTDLQIAMNCIQEPKYGYEMLQRFFNYAIPDYVRYPNGPQGETMEASIGFYLWIGSLYKEAGSPSGAIEPMTHSDGTPYLNPETGKQFMTLREAANFGLAKGGLNACVLGFYFAGTAMFAGENQQPGYKALLWFHKNVASAFSIPEVYSSSIYHDDYAQMMGNFKLGEKFGGFRTGLYGWNIAMNLDSARKVSMANETSWTTVQHWEQYHRQSFINEAHVNPDNFEITGDYLGGILRRYFRYLVVNNKPNIPVETRKWWLRENETNGLTKGFPFAARIHGEVQYTSSLEGMAQNKMWAKIEALIREIEIEFPKFAKEIGFSPEGTLAVMTDIQASTSKVLDKYDFQRLVTASLKRDFLDRIKKSQSGSSTTALAIGAAALYALSQG